MTVALCGRLHKAHNFLRVRLGVTLDLFSFTLRLFAYLLWTLCRKMWGPLSSCADAAAYREDMRACSWTENQGNLSPVRAFCLQKSFVTGFGLGFPLYELQQTRVHGSGASWAAVAKLAAVVL